MIPDMQIKKSDLKQASSIINEHLESLAFPLDSYLDDLFFLADIYEVEIRGKLAAYFAISEATLNYFHIKKEFYRHAAALFEYIINEFKLKEVNTISQDTQLNALMVEWDYQRERLGCWFIDSCCQVDKTNKIPDATFRLATNQDIRRIRAISGSFFNEVSGGFNNLEERIVAKTIFVLEEADDLHGCGIIEKGRICQGYASIGMFTNPAFRQLGTARTILLNLKDYVYDQGLSPVAGCWYYNTLSRKSMASAGMIATSIGYTAKLIKKDNPPKRTGNPPGEAVE